MSELPSIAIVVGDEALLVEEAVGRLVEAALDPAMRALNHADLVADAARNALSLARTQPMMARYRVVVIREMHRAPKDLLEALLEYAAAPNPSTVLVLTGTKLPPGEEGVDLGRRLQNKVAKVGRVERFKSGETGAAPFARERAREAGCDLDGAAARLLVELVGSELATVKNELEKAIAYVGGSGRIEAADITAVCSVVAEAEVWDLTDAVVRRNADKALAATHRLLQDSSTGDGSAHHLLALVTWQVRQLLELQGSERGGAPLSDYWRRAPQWKRQAALDVLRKYPLHPARVMESLERTNRQINRSHAGPSRVFEALVLELTS